MIGRRSPSPAVTPLPGAPSSPAPPEAMPCCCYPHPCKEEEDKGGRIIGGCVRREKTGLDDGVEVGSGRVEPTPPVRTCTCVVRASTNLITQPPHYLDRGREDVVVDRPHELARVGVQRGHRHLLPQLHHDGALVVADGDPEEKRLKNESSTVVSRCLPPPISPHVSMEPTHPRRSAPPQLELSVHPSPCCCTLMHARTCCCPWRRPGPRPAPSRS